MTTFYKMTRNAMCLPTAFACVMDIEPDFLIKEYLQDIGGAVIDPRLPENDPRRYRSYHVQELVDVALMLGYAVTYIEANPMLTNSVDYLVSVFAEQQNRIIQHMEASTGVLVMCNNKTGIRHALVNDGGLCYDPATDKLFHYSLMPDEYTFVEYYRIDKYENNRTSDRRIETNQEPSG